MVVVHRNDTLKLLILMANWMFHMLHKTGCKEEESSISALFSWRNNQVRIRSINRLVEKDSVTTMPSVLSVSNNNFPVPERTESKHTSLSILLVVEDGSVSQTYYVRSYPRCVCQSHLPALLLCYSVSEKSIAQQRDWSSCLRWQPSTSCWTPFGRRATAC